MTSGFRMATAIQSPTAAANVAETRARPIEAAVCAAGTVLPECPTSSPSAAVPRR